MVQHQEVRVDLPLILFCLFRLPQYLQRIWIALSKPWVTPDAVLFVPILTILQLLSTISSGSWNNSSLPLESIWGSNSHTNFQKIDSSSPSVCHLGINFLQTKNVSTKVKAKISSCIRVCHLFVFQMLGRCKMPCRFYFNPITFTVLWHLGLYHLPWRVEESWKTG